MNKRFSFVNNLLWERGDTFFIVDFSSENADELILKSSRLGLMPVRTSEFCTISITQEGTDKSDSLHHFMEETFRASRGSNIDLFATLFTVSRFHSEIGINPETGNLTLFQIPEFIISPLLIAKV